MIATLYVHDHTVHFYHLHALDWVDVVSALKANPKATAELAQKISNWPKSSVGYFTDIQNRFFPQEPKPLSDLYPLKLFQFL